MVTVKLLFYTTSYTKMMCLCHPLKSILVSLGFLSSVRSHNIVLLFKIQPLFIAKGKYFFNFGIKIGTKARK